MAKHLTKRNIARIRALRRAGKSGTEIAKATKRSLKTIYKVIATPSTNGNGQMKSATTITNGSELQKAISAVVDREVQARMRKIRERVLQAFEG